MCIRDRYMGSVIVESEIAIRDCVVLSYKTLTENVSNEVIMQSSGLMKPGLIDAFKMCLCRISVLLNKEPLLYLPLQFHDLFNVCLLYTSPSPRDGLLSRMPSSA
eukprot:TRINITY_DN3045_c0_g1_i1.p1 TRINITY_DN3045_c0_g1~~TRINITY_DN3045_c0_g1_i1.p1  ORF type:complete len:105 (-),score=13.67 TRINITY_DN3045_c0_g1_i1:14-328(-)